MGERLRKDGPVLLLLSWSQQILINYIYVIDCEKKKKHMHKTEKMPSLITNRKFTRYFSIPFLKKKKIRKFGIFISLLSTVLASPPHSVSDYSISVFLMSQLCLISSVFSRC